MTWLSTEDVAAQTGFTTRTIQRWARERRIPHIRVGRTIRFTPDQVSEIIAEYTVKPAPFAVEVDTPNPSFIGNRAVVMPMRRNAG